VRTLAAGALALLLAGAGACAYPQDRHPEPLTRVYPPDTLRLPHASAKGLFFTPWASDPRNEWDALRWLLFSRNPYDRSQKPVVPRVANDGSYLAGTEHSATLTWVGHATFAIHDRDDVVLTDPHFGPRALVPRRKVPPGIPLASVPADSLAVVSHNHYDHLDAYSVEHLPASVAWFVPRGLAAWFRARGRRDVTELDWWQSARRGRWTITCLPAQHWSRRIEQPTNSTLWCAWLLDSGDYRYFFAGDTGYFHGFAEYRREFGAIDVAMLPIGAYEPRWFMKHQHMSPRDALQAFADLGARHLLPMHWGTFDLTDEPIDEPPRELLRVMEEERTDAERVRVLAIGERWKVPGPEHRQPPPPPGAPG
jgi:N-acyl-phosphatidylethanolamine-hydrolysing phospholipase D